MTRARRNTVRMHVAALTPEVKMAGLSLSNMLSSSSFVVFLPAESTSTYRSRSNAFVELLRKGEVSAMMLKIPLFNQLKGLTKLSTSSGNKQYG